jgi:hypothetical protein
MIKLNSMLDMIIQKLFSILVAERFIIKIQMVIL